MSHDQKPGKVRVVGGAAPAPAPARRLRDGARVDVEPSDAASIEAPDEAAAKSSRFMLPILFLAGCAIGGTALPLLSAS